MGQIDVTDAWLYKYMSIVDEAIINEIEKNVDYDYAFSDEFNRKMERTIRKEKFIPFWNSVSKFGKSVAIFALVIVTSLFAVTMSVEAYRIQFFETVKTTCSSGIKSSREKSIRDSTISVLRASPYC